MYSLIFVAVNYSFKYSIVLCYYSGERKHYTIYYVHSRKRGKVKAVLSIHFYRFHITLLLRCFSP